MRRFLCSVIVAASLLLISAPGYAQVSITGAVAGTVTDSSDAVLPGVTVVLRDEGTGIQKTTVTNEAGDFAFRDLSFGSYQVTITLQGFQSAVYNKVIVEAGRTTDLRVKLAVGAIEQNVTVEGRTPVLELTSNALSSTLTNKEVNELPLAGRNAFTYARLVPGAVAPQGTGSTHFNGLPGGTINPTIDGINNSSNGWKSGGTSFFGTVPARLGAVEQVTVETAGLGGDDGSTGGVNLKFVTRRGTNRYTGSFFEQYRTDKLNANTFGNIARGLPKEELRRHDFGGNFGGPIARRGPLANRLFAFVNWEVEWIPQTQTREATTLTDEARQGLFRYATSTGEQRTVNVYQLAAAAGLPAAPDPTIAALLAKQAEARQFAAPELSANLITEDLSWLEPQKQLNYYPTIRIDYQAKNNLSFMTSYNRYAQDAQGRRIWPIPGFPINNGTFDSGWWVWSTGTNWTLSPNMVNELRFGIQHSGDTNEVGRRREFFELNGRIHGNLARFDLPLIDPLVADAAPVIGSHYITTITNTLTYVRGNHTFKFGGNYRDTSWRDRSFDAVGGGYLGVPEYTLGIETGDPASSVFATSNVPGLQSGDVGELQDLYALLTGRLGEVRTGRVVDPATLQYSDSVFRENWTSAEFGGLFVQDSWRVNPNLTLNYGLRYEVNVPPYNETGTVSFPTGADILGPSTQLFAPGELNGAQNPVFQRGRKAASTDWNNFAPRIGFAWTPRFGDGFLGTLFGRGQETVIRGGWDITYYDEGTNMFAFSAGSNTGHSQVLLIDSGTSFTPGSLSLQSPLPPFQASPAEYKEVWNQSEITFVNGLGAMSSDLQTGYVQAWNIGLQRQIAPNTVLEVRYLGNRGYNVWHQFSLNEVNIFENGFLDDFKRAQQNLAINEANGRTGFANNGLPGQAAIPIFEAAFGARGAAGALPNNQSFTNGNFINDLRNGEAGRLAGRLATSATYLCRMVGSAFSPCTTGGRNFTAAGPYAMNFFMANPYVVNGLTIVDDDGWSRYHGLQLQLRRRYANWLTANVNYTLAKNTGNVFADNSTQSANYFTLRDKSRNDGPAPFDVRHVLQAFGTYDLPFGEGRRWSSDSGLINGLAGGWTFGAIFTLQSGTPFRLISGRQTVNGSDAGVILMNGTTVEDLQRMINIRPGRAPEERYFVDAALVGPDGRANPQFLAVPTEPGQWGEHIILRGKNIWSLDASFNKTTTIFGRSQITLHVTIQNLLNRPVWSSPGFLQNVNISSTTFGITTNPVNNNSPRNLYTRISVRF